MQPYFFPYLGYYSLIRNTDKFILFDTVQFIRHGWIERNRVLKPSEGWQYVAAPLKKKSLSTLICDCEIRRDEPWKDKLISQLGHYKRTAPFFRKTVRVVEDSLDVDTDSIVKLNQNILIETCKYLGMPIDISILSEMGLVLDTVSDPGEWALEICKSLKADEYLNPSGGRHLFDQAKFTESGVKLTIVHNNLTSYEQGRPAFEAGLSIIDVMMFNDAASTLRLIEDASLAPINAQQ
ncbi:WbqC family protein [Caenimonas terrae]|uniref:WbqC family protein n=1 Tax=Caenimonas terrae TaxID=696074 RepID=A0ABW0NH66_9BURK